MEKNVCLITGANSGIGFELAKGMAQENYKVVSNESEMAKQLWQIR